MSENRARRACLGLAASLLVSVTAGAVGSTTAPAAASGAALVQGTVHQALFGVAFDGDRGVAVGAMGEIMESADSGKSWTAVSPRPTPLALLGVGVHGSRRIAVGQQGTILLSENAGPWTAMKSGSKERLLAVSVNEKGQAVAVGSFGTILVSGDGGHSWEPRTIDWSKILKDPVDPHLFDVIVGDNGAVTVVGEYGLILRSSDAGARWTATTNGEASLFGLELRPDGVGYAVGQEGTVLATRDGGARWTRLVTGSQAVLLSVSSAADGRVVIAGMREMLQSSDNGATWKPRTDQDFATAWYSQLAMPADGGLVMVGHSGRIVRLQDPIKK